jgi:hypothetical protein
MNGKARELGARGVDRHPSRALQLEVPAQEGDAHARRDKREYALVADLNLPNVRKWNEDLLFIRDRTAARARSSSSSRVRRVRVVLRDVLRGPALVFTVTPDYKIAFNATPSKAYVGRLQLLDDG